MPESNGKKIYDRSLTQKYTFNEGQDVPRSKLGSFVLGEELWVK